MDGGIKFDVSANTAKFDADMGRVANSASTASGKIKQAFSGLGGILAGGAALAGLKSLMDGFDRIAKMSTRFGTSAESVQRVAVAADLAGTSIEVVANSMQKASIAASKASLEGGNFAELFERAGISAQQFNRAQLDEKLLMVARAFEAARGNADKTNAIIEILGSRAAGQLIPLISNVQALEAEMGNVSVASNEVVSEIEKANDRLTRFGNNIKVAFAGGLDALGKFSERLGDLAAGGTGKTISEMEAEEMRQNAISRLRNRGELLPDDTTTRTAQKFVGSPVPVTVEESLPGPNAEENVRRVNAELAAMRAELEAAKTPVAQITDEIEEQVSKTEERKQQQQYLKQLSLEIKEAQAAGNQALADDLKEYEALIKAAIDYEGNLEMAARDVNAAHRERLRLQQESLQKTIQQVEQEIQLAETMAYGTDEARKKAEWMRVYNETLEKTGRDDLARRAANVETFEAPEDLATRSGAGGVASLPQSTPFDRLRDIAKTDPRARAALFRLQAEEADMASRADALRGMGRFNSAAREEMRGERRSERSAAREIQAQMSESLFGSRNLGDAVRNFERDARLAGITTSESMSRMGIDRQVGESSRDALQRFLSEQTMTEAQRREREKQQQGEGGSQAQAVALATEGSLQRLITEIVQRLPQNALAA